MKNILFKISLFFLLVACSPTPSPLSPVATPTLLPISPIVTPVSPLNVPAITVTVNKVITGPLTIDVSFTNNSDKNKRVTTVFQLKAKDADDFLHNPTVTPDCPFVGGELLPGETIRGNVCFKIDDAQTLVWDENPLKSGKILINLGEE